MSSRLAKRRSASSPSAVYERLKRMIFDQQIAPGDPLPEEELARTFRVSRTPVHEALVRLEKDKLIVLQPWKGAFVRGITVEDVQELYQVREALEGIVARLAAEVLPEEQIAALEKNCTVVAELGRNGDPHAFFEAAREFHWILIRGAGNQRVKEILGNIREQLSAVRKYLVNNPGKVGADLEDHARILDAVRRRDPDEAEGFMRRHIRTMRSALLGALR
jgi:DNA-binding GntR family transcriptional regulator